MFFGIRVKTTVVKSARYDKWPHRHIASYRIGAFILSAAPYVLKISEFFFYTHLRNTLFGRILVYEASAEFMWSKRRLGYVPETSRSALARRHASRPHRKSEICFLPIARHLFACICTLNTNIRFIRVAKSSPPPGSLSWRHDSTPAPDSGNLIYFCFLPILCGLLVLVHLSICTYM